MNIKLFQFRLLRLYIKASIDSFFLRRTCRFEISWKLFSESQMQSCSAKNSIYIDISRFSNSSFSKPTARNSLMWNDGVTPWMNLFWKVSFFVPSTAINLGRNCKKSKYYSYFRTYNSLKLPAWIFPTKFSWKEPFLKLSLVV